MVVSIIEGLHCSGVSVLLVEQPMEAAVLDLIQSVLIMNKEVIVLRGTLENLREHSEVIEKYLEV